MIFFLDYKVHAHGLSKETINKFIPHLPSYFVFTFKIKMFVKTYLFSLTALSVATAAAVPIQGSRNVPRNLQHMVTVDLATLLSNPADLSSFSSLENAMSSAVRQQDISQAEALRQQLVSLIDSKANPADVAQMASSYVSIIDHAQLPPHFGSVMSSIATQIKSPDVASHYATLADILSSGIYSALTALKQDEADGYLDGNGELQTPVKTGDSEDDTTSGSSASVRLGVSSLGMLVVGGISALF